jgi:uncharacterized protein YyaL (SSP411 family)
MSIFLTPQGEPFYGGTYFPSTRRYGMPSFREVLEAMIETWQNERGEVERVGKEITRHLRETSQRSLSADSSNLRPGVNEEATRVLLKTYDWQKGGWGQAPRFPQPMAIEFLLLQATRGDEHTLQAAVHALSMMSRGGMYDLVGGGFHRYSTDNDWLVPHFEKMLYDNAQLALVYLHAFQLTGKPWFHHVCTETLDFIAREMTGPQGGFYSSLDADSEGTEGKYYIWKPGEIEAALKNQADLNFFRQVYPLGISGNFEDSNILQRQAGLETLAEQLHLREDDLIARLASIHRLLYAAREQRVRPATDDKVLVAWNALALRTFAQAARYLHRADYLEIARKNAGFLLSALYQDGRLMRAWRGGQARHDAYLEDYAGLILALLDLYQSDPTPRWFAAARQLGQEMLDLFRDPQGGFFDTRAGQTDLITRPKETQDNATPSGSAQAAAALLRLAAFDDLPAWHAAAIEAIAGMQDVMVRYPTSFAFWLQAADFAAGPVQQIAVVGPQEDLHTQALLHILWDAYRPRLIAAFVEGSAETSGDQAPALLAERGMLRGQPTAYVCQNFTCQLPVTAPEDFARQLA